jgi:hypothetical protein
VTDDVCADVVAVAAYALATPTDIKSDLKTNIFQSRYPTGSNWKVEMECENRGQVSLSKRHFIICMQGLYSGVSPPRFSMPSKRPFHLFAKKSPELFLPSETTVCSLKVLPPRLLGDPPPSPFSWHQPGLLPYDCWKENISG